MGRKSIEGIIVPVVTPFRQDLSVDYKGFENAVSYFNQNEYIDGLFIMGATGEHSALTFDERKRLIDISMGMERKKKFVLNTGSGTLESTLKLTEYATAKGADVFGVVIPREYTTFDEVFRYFEKLHEFETDIFLYQTGGSGYKPDVREFGELIDLGDIAGVKDSCSSQDMVRHLRYIQHLKDRISVIQGVEMLYLSSLVMGGDGVIGGGCNVYPFLLRQVARCFAEGDMLRAMKYQYLVNEWVETVYEGQTGNQSMKYFLRLSGVVLDCCSRTEKARLTRAKEEKIEKLYRDLSTIQREGV